jgi:hypothetical protein
LIAWIVAVLAITGALMVASGKPKQAFHGHLVWIGTNGFQFFYNFRHDPQEAMQFAVFLILALYGVWKWR